MNRFSQDWKDLEARVQERLDLLSRGLRSGNKQNQYEDTCTRWERIGWIQALEWVLRIPDDPNRAEDVCFLWLQHHWARSAKQCYRR